jgi:hypothetical protein
MRSIPWLVLFSLLLVACGGATPSPTPAPSPTPRPSTPSPETPALLPEEEPPPRTGPFTTDFSRHTVPYDQILSGGVSKDAIPAIDEPQFVGVTDADAWLQPKEAVVVVQIGDEARAYPIRILTWHEIVNDVIDETPVAVTYCPLCTTVIAFDRRLDDRVLDFGTTGRLRFSNLVMYDRQTESWWQQGSGQGIAGEFAGRQLTFLPVALIAWEDFRAARPEGRVLSRETGYTRDYGRNPYPGYDDPDRFPQLYQGPEIPDDLPPVARVLGIPGEEHTAYPFELLQEVQVVNTEIAGRPIVVIWQPGMASPLDANLISQGRDVGAANAFARELDGEELTFQVNEGALVDEQTGSTWNLLGQAVSGPREGERLEPVVAHNFFWFAWSAFYPETGLYTP